MEIKTIKRNISMTSRLRGMRVGERVRISSNRDSVKVALYRLKKEGMSFKTSVVGMATGIIVERIG